MQTGPPSAKLSVPLFSASRLGQRRSRLSSVYRWGRAPELWSRLLSHCPECEIPAQCHIAANKDPVLCAAAIYAEQPAKTPMGWRIGHHFLFIISPAKPSGDRGRRPSARKRCVRRALVQPIEQGIEAFI